MVTHQCYMMGPMSLTWTILINNGHSSMLYDGSYVTYLGSMDVSWAISRLLASVMVTLVVEAAR